MQSETGLANTFAIRREAARAYLWREMNARGLFERDGWRIVETTRETANGTELVMRPMHRALPAPEGLECVVEIREDEVIESHCEQGVDSQPAAR